jgi:hypothetical protein
MDELLESIETKSRYEIESYDSLVFLMRELTLLKINKKKTNASRTANVDELFEVHTSYAQLPESLL